MSSLWRHPTKTRVVLPWTHAAAIAVMQMGISDLAVIADAVGLDAKTVKQIDKADDAMVRHLALGGIPAGEHFKLKKRVRCPRCNGCVQTAPCVACTRAQSA